MSPEATAPAAPPAPPATHGAGRVLASIGVVQVLILLVALVRAKVLSVLLGPGGFGIVSTIDQTVTTLVTLGALSLPFTGLKFMARSHSEGPEAFGSTFATFLRALVTLAALTAAACVAIVLWRPGAFGADLAPYRGALLVAVLGVPAAMLAILFVNTLAAAQRGAASAVLNLASVASLAVGAVVGERVGGIPGLYVGVAVAGVVSTAGAIAYLRASLGLRVLARGAGLFAELRSNPQIVSFSLMIYGALAAYSLALLATRYVVLAELGDVQAGLLQALFSLAVSVGAVMTPMSNLFFAPLVNRRMPVEAKVRAADDFARQMLGLLLLAALPLVLFPQLVVSILYSSKFLPAAGALYLFIVWQCVYQLANVYLQLLIGLDDVAFMCGLTCVAYAAVAAAFPPLVQALGVGGVGVALAAAMALAGAAAAVRLRVKFGRTVARDVVWRSALVVGALAAAGRLFGGAAAPGELTPRGAAARVGYALGTLAVAWWAMGRDERARLVTLAAQVARRVGVPFPARLTGPAARP